MNKRPTFLLVMLLAALGCGGGSSGGKGGTAPAGPAALSSGPHSLSFSIAFPTSAQVPAGGISLRFALPKGLTVATTGTANQIAPSALATGSAVTGPSILQGTYSAATQQVSLALATAVNETWSGEFLRLAFTVPAGSTVTAGDLQGLGANLLAYKVVGEDTAAHSTVLLTPQAPTTLTVLEP